MDRRTFLGGALALGAASAAQGALRHPLVRSAVRSQAVPVTNTGRTLVLVTLSGGLDGLDAVVPFGDPAYGPARGAITAPPANLLAIAPGYGLHPAFAGLKAFHDSGKLAIVRGVGYPNPNYSHFTSMDIWQSGTPSGEIATGWLGRWLDRTGSDPLRALVLGPNLPLAYVGDRERASAIAVSPSPAAQLPPGSAAFVDAYRVLERHRAGQTVLETGVARSGTSLLAVGHNVAGALGIAPPTARYFAPAAGGLGNQLAVVAQLINAQLRTQVYGVTLGGFDAHAGETASYAPLFGQLDAAISGFFRAIAGGPLAGGVVMVVYSEFGRRVAPNASGGTDHGSGNVAFVLGEPVVGGFYGDEPSLTQLDANGSLVVTTDFRSIYATLLEQVLGVDPSAIVRGAPGAVPFFG